MWLEFGALGEIPKVLDFAMFQNLVRVHLQFLVGMHWLCHIYEMLRLVFHFVGDTKLKVV